MNPEAPMLKIWHPSLSFTKAIGLVSSSDVNVSNRFWHCCLRIGFALDTGQQRVNEGFNHQEKWLGHGHASKMAHKKVLHSCLGYIWSSDHQLFWKVSHYLIIFNQWMMDMSTGNYIQEWQDLHAATIMGVFPRKHAENPEFNHQERVCMKMSVLQFHMKLHEIVWPWFNWQKTLSNSWWDKHG